MVVCNLDGNRVPRRVFSGEVGLRRSGTAEATRSRAGGEGRPPPRDPHLPAIAGRVLVGVDASTVEFVRALDAGGHSVHEAVLAVQQDVLVTPLQGSESPMWALVPAGTEFGRARRVLGTAPSGRAGFMAGLREREIECLVMSMAGPRRRCRRSATARRDARRKSRESSPAPDRRAPEQSTQRVLWQKSRLAARF